MCVCGMSQNKLQCVCVFMSMKENVTQCGLIDVFLIVLECECSSAVQRKRRLVGCFTVNLRLFVEFVDKKEKIQNITDL